jgi:hypothetical protein
LSFREKEPNCEKESFQLSFNKSQAWNFGKKWRIFHRPLNVSLELTEGIIKACCLLHNFVRARHGYNFDDTLTIQGFDEMLNKPFPGGRTARYQG